MHFQKYIDANMDTLIRDLQGCIRIPSLYTEDGSGYPYGKPVQECLEYVLDCAQKLGFETVNFDNQLGWCEYGSGEEMVANDSGKAVATKHYVGDDIWNFEI